MALAEKELSEEIVPIEEEPVPAKPAAPAASKGYPPTPPHVV